MKGTYSKSADGLDISIGESDTMSIGEEVVGQSTEIVSVEGVWSWWVVTTNGALWGNGEISIESTPGPGDDEGRGGVVTFPNLL